MRSLWFAALMIGSAACSSSPAGPMDAAGGGEGVATATGSFEGASFTGLEHALSEDASGSKGSTLEVVLAQNAQCSDATNGPSANAVFITLSMYSIDTGTGMSAAPRGGGTFSLDTTSAGPFAEADVVVFDASCNQVPASTGKFSSGTVTLTSVSDDTAVGTFDLSSGADHASGSFSTALCVGAGELAFPGSTASCH